ncbi:MAG: hypothetical protein H6842_14650 [Rhodospirillaceae bacterium]|nr:hypothetical protein [Rhodospirillaceae bacterium]
MATVNYFEGSFGAAPWQVVVDPTAPMIEIAVGVLSPWHNGWAHLNIDGTYTVFLGEDIVFNALGEPIGGTLTDVVRMTQITEAFDPDDVLAAYSGPFDTILNYYNAFYQGGTALIDRLSMGDDTIDIDSPSTGGIPIPAPLVDAGAGDDTVYGSEHHDTIYAGDGDDTVYGYAGSDDIRGESGRDDIDGGDGNDFLYGGKGADTLDGGDGDDHLYGGTGADIVHGGRGDDHIEGGGQGDSLYGSDGEDDISGGNGDDTIWGDAALGAGFADTLNGDDGDDDIFGYGGDDTINGGRGADNLQGGSGDDYINGGLGQDEIYGQGGDDTLLGGGGDDVIDGGNGFDTAVYFLPQAQYSVTYDGGGNVEVQALSGNEGSDLLVGIERIAFADGILFV